MKLKNTFALLLTLSLIQPAISNAREIYIMHWRGKSFSPGDDGHIVKRKYTEKDIIREAARDNGITDLKALAYVYVANERNTEVVWKATGQTVREIFQFEYSYTDVTNAKDTHAVKQAFIEDEYHGQIGSIFGNEKSRRNANSKLVKYRFTGRFQFAYPDTDTIYSGVFTTGRKINDGSGD